LPGMRSQTLSPEHLVARVEQHNADVGPEALSVEHNLTPIL
jgi:hypothetical protein